MNRGTLAASLAGLTGSLRPGPGATPNDLRRARLHVARALLAGQPADDIRAVVAGAPIDPSWLSVTDGERNLASSAIDERRRRKLQGRPPLSTLANVRTSPVRYDLDPSTPSSLIGIKVAESIGPFVDHGGLPRWIDILQPIRQKALVRGPGTGSTLASLPVGSGSHGVFALGRGSVWLNCRLLDPASPANSYAGFRIKRGTLTVSGPLTNTAKSIRIGSSASAQLEVELDPPVAPSATTGPGAIAAEASATLPKTATFILKPGSTEVTHFDPLTATAFGSPTVALVRSGAAPMYSADLRHLLLFADPAPAAFAPTSHASKIFALGDAAHIEKAAWALPVAQTTVDKLGPAEGAGSATLLIGSGVAADWSGLAPSKKLQATVVMVSPGQVGLLGVIGSPPFIQRFKLWDERPNGVAPRRSTAEYRFPKKGLLLYIAKPGAEMMLALGGAAVAHTDRPLRADGQRLAVKTTSATLVIADSSAGHQVVLVGSSKSDPNLLAIAIENALLRVHPPEMLLLVGALNGDEVPSGGLALGYRLRSLVSTLPDPYAARIFRGDRDGDVDIGSIFSTVVWPEPAKPDLGFVIAQLAGPQQARRSIMARALLDVSSAADQLGVAFMAQPEALRASGMLASASLSPSDLLQIQRLCLKARGDIVGIFTVPEISWEAVYNDPKNPPPPPVDPADDGGPSTFQVETAHLMPVAPAALLADMLGEIVDGSEAHARVTLPFGIVGHIANSHGATFTANRPEFPNSMRGGIQVRMQPRFADSQVNAAFDGEASTFGPSGSTYGDRVLSLTVAGLFNSQFTKTLPVRRYDLCGYGASVFSDFRDPNVKTAGIIKALFNVFVGRTSYEVVQAQSYIYPWAIRVVRTITLERSTLGTVVREDSGWQAASDGRFQFPTKTGPDPFKDRVHRGAIDSLVKIRHIRELGSPLPPMPSTGLIWQPALFDADLHLVGAIKVLDGASPEGALPTRDVTGYLLAGPANAVPLPKDVAALLTGRAATGPASCTVAIDGSDTKLRVSGFDASATKDGASAVIVASLRGGPVLPSDGAWAVARRATTSTAPPLPLDPHTPVPLVKHAAETSWHYADPSDILQLSTPANEYGFIQATGTQKLFFARPRIVPNQKSFQIPDPPHLADVGALFNAASAFPSLGSALAFEGLIPNLDVAGAGVSLHHEFDVPASVGPKTIVDFGVVEVPIVYEDDKHTRSHVVVDIKPGGWTIEIQRASFPLLINTPKLGTLSAPLIRIVGDVFASSTAQPTLRNLKIVFGGVLDPIQNVFANLQQLASFIPGNAPKLDVRFSNGQLSVRNVYSVPKLPLGAGFIKDVSLDMGMTMQLSPMSLGFTIGIGSPERPFHWLVSPLSGTGLIQVGVQNEKPTVLVRAGVGVGLSIDVGIASGSASVVLALQAEIVGSDVKLLVLLTVEASVDVLMGLASATLSLTAGLGITPKPIPPRVLPITKPLDSVTFIGAVAVGIHISICWLVHVDFDGYWEFSQTVDVPDITSVLPV